MKKHLSIILLLVLTAVFTSCETNEPATLVEVPTDDIDSNLVLTDIQRTFNDIIGEYNLPSRVITRQTYMFGSYSSNVYGYTNGYSYKRVDSIWSKSYQLFSEVNILEEIDEATSNDGGIPYHLGMAQILEAYAYMLLVDYFGEVPFSQALQPNEFPHPIVDSGESIYTAQLELLDVAIANLISGDMNQALVPDDLYYGIFNSSNWIALANTLKIRAHLNIGNAAGINTALSGNIIDQNEEDFQFSYATPSVTDPNSEHPIYSEYSNGGVPYYMSSQLYDFMNVGDANPPFIETESPVDPRARYYFYRQTDIDPTINWANLPCVNNIANYDYCYVGNKYWGRDHADNEGIPNDIFKRTAHGLYPIGGAFDSNQFIEGRAVRDTDASLAGAGIRPIYLAAFTHFALAEGALTLGSTGNPRELLELGIRKSLTKVRDFAIVNGVNTGGLEMNSAHINEYVNAVLDEYDTVNAAGKLAVITREHFIAAWGNGTAPYNLYRRTGLPDLQNPVYAAGEFPRSFLYPEFIVNGNPNIQQRVVTDKVFWDVMGFLD